MTLVPVVDAAGAAALDRETIERGVPSRALMQRAGAAAAAEIARRFPAAVRRGVVVHLGPGNNGGDGWVVARALMAAGADVRVRIAGEPKTEDARFERALTPERIEQVAIGLPGLSPRDLGVDLGPSPELRGLRFGGAGVHVDALLGTGASGAPRPEIAAAATLVNEARAQGAVVVALDVPTGVDATTGEAAEAAVRADLTLAFGSMKRGLLVARPYAGEIAVLDIGLAGRSRAEACLVDARWVRAHVPSITADAHKGTRRRLLIVGGGPGMVGAAVLAARAAYRSGVGLVRLCVHESNVPLVQQMVPEAIADAWPADDDEARPLVEWTDGLLVGPGLGRGDDARRLVERVLNVQDPPAVLDADALNAFEGEPDALAALLVDRRALVTPHPLEFARLAAIDVTRVTAERFEIGAALAARLGAAVLLKGVPTVVTAPNRPALVSATGTPALAVGGSGDLLAGIAGTLLAQTRDPLAAGACAAWVHGRAAELASAGRGTRGVTLDEVLARLGDAWPGDEGPAPYPVLATLPRV